MLMALELALGRVQAEWHRWRNDHRLLIDSHRRFPYLGNNAFLMRTELYAQVVADIGDWGQDEVPMNTLIRTKRLPLCFISNSFGLHAAYSTHPFGPEMERMALE